MGLTQAIGQFLAGVSYEQLPPQATPIVVSGFTDCTAVLISGLREPVAHIIGRSLSEAFDPKSVARLEAVPGVSAPDLALLYGTAAHAEDYDDTGLAGHPSAVLVPAILAECHETPATGEDMIAAYVAGYEVWAELIRRDRDQHHLKGWHPSAVFGAVAAAGASATLRKLTAGQASHAVGIAASLAGGIVANFGSMTKPFHIGRAAQSGLTAARLAQAGMTANPDAIEHKSGFLRAISPHGTVDTTSAPAFGTMWHILKTGVNIKLYPMCYATHRMIDATIYLCHTHSLAPDAIHSVEALIGDNQAGMLRNARPQTALDAKFSGEFAIAVAAIAGRCTQSEVSDLFVQRPDVQNFFAKVRIRTTDQKDSEEPALAPFDQVTIQLTNGATLVSEPVAYPRGHFKRGISHAAMWDKFSACTTSLLGDDAARQLFDRLQKLPMLSSLEALAAQPSSSEQERV